MKTQSVEQGTILRNKRTQKDITCYSVSSVFLNGIITRYEYHCHFDGKTKTIQEKDLRKYSFESNKG